MQFTRFSGSIVFLGLTLSVFAPNGEAEARSRANGTHAATAARVSSGAYDAGARFSSRAIRSGMSRRSFGAISYASAGWGGRLQCVPFARENTGIELSGNASGWWQGADGVYARGARPEVGSVLNFRANGRMRLGHVAVVSRVIDGRNIQIDHANWGGPGVGRGGISRNVQVVDVSERNDWTAVRVSLGSPGEFGSVYPTYGFIYDRADAGTMIANSGIAPQPVLAAAPRDLRPAAERMQVADLGDTEEVAEAFDEPRGRRSGYRSVRMARSMQAKATVQRVSAQRMSVQRPSVQRVSSHGAQPGRPAAKRHRL